MSEGGDSPFHQKIFYFHIAAYYIVDKITAGERLFSHIPKVQAVAPRVKSAKGKNAADG